VGSPFRDARRLRRKAVQGAVLAVTRSYAEDLLVTVGGDAGGDENRARDTTRPLTRVFT
jgi:hypothetical protein